MYNDIGNQLIYASSLFFGLTFPLIRAYFRKRNNIVPAFSNDNVRHDVASGLAVPYFAIMILSPFITFHVDNYAFALAGLFAIYLVTYDLIDHSRCRRYDDNPKNNDQEPRNNKSIHR